MKKFSEMKFVKPNIKKLEEKINLIIEEFKNAETYDKQNNAYKKFNKLNSHLETNMTIASIRFTLDSINPENIKNQEFIDEVSPLISSFMVKFL